MLVFQHSYYDAFVVSPVSCRGYVSVFPRSYRINCALLVTQAYAAWPFSADDPKNDVYAIFYMEGNTVRPGETYLRQSQHRDL